MPDQAAAPAAITREKLIDLLNEDLSREYQAIIAYVVYSQVLKGAQYMNIADELAVHATEELAHAIALSNRRCAIMDHVEAWNLSRGLNSQTAHVSPPLCRHEAIWLNSSVYMCRQRFAHAGRQNRLMLPLSHWRVRWAHLCTR
jgi:ferritin-like protein